MGDLIRREDIAGFIRDNRRTVTLAQIEQAIVDAPAADAVEVVRCRECKHWSGRNDKHNEVTVIGYCRHRNHHIMPIPASWFCADGEPREENAAD